MFVTLTKRNKLAVGITATAAFTVFVFGASILLFRLGLFNDVLFYLFGMLFLLPFLYLFKESLAQKAFLFFMIWGVTSFISSLCNWVEFWLAPGPLSLAVKYGLLACCYMALIPLYLKFWRHRIRQMLSLFDKGGSLYAIFPFLAFVLFAALFGPRIRPSSLLRFAQMILFEGLLVLTYYILFSHCFTLYRKQRAEDDLVRAENQLLLQMKYYEEVEKGVGKLNKLLHETRHHFVAIASLAQTGESPAITQYIGQLLDAYGSSNAHRYCENGVANAVIGSYIETAEKHGIAVSVELNLPAEIGIDKYELYTLFGNAMENAIESCQRIPEVSALYERRYIDIMSWVEKGRLVLRIENSCHELRMNDEGNFLSSKGEKGGLGLENLKTVVDRYEGCLSCKGQDDSFVLSAVLYPRSS